MDQWASANWNHWWASWLLHHPSGAATIIGQGMPNALHPPVYNPVTSPLPADWSSAFFGSFEQRTESDLSGTYRVEPMLVWWSIAFVLAVALIRRRVWRISPALVLFLTAGGALAAVTIGTLTLQTPSFETGREAVGVTVQFILSTVVLVGVLLDRFLLTSRDQKGGAR